MTGPLKEELQNRLPWLLQDLGFRVTHHDYFYKQMGDSFVELQSDSLRIRFIRDKSRIAVELASLSEPERWFELGFLWYALTGYRPEPELEGWAWFLRDHLGELADALGPNFLQTKQQFEQERQEGREGLARRVPPLTLAGRIHRFRRTPVGMMLMGPLGWIVAAGLIVLVLLTR